jgi:hypothetical protein
MRPLAINFATLHPWSNRLRWFAGGAGALMLVVSTAAWLLPPSAEAGYMGRTIEHRAPPGLDESAAIDAAVRGLNFPWVECFAALEAMFATSAEGILTRVEVDPVHVRVRVDGQVADAAAVMGLPARLRTLPGIADVILLGQEPLTAAVDHAVAFSLELQLKERP